MGNVNPLDLLNFLEHILDSDPLIDEVGFIHPSQFAVLGEGADICSANGESEASKAILSGSIFLSADHKLGISTDVILLLYDAAKHAFMEASRQYKMIDLNRAYNTAESDGGSTCSSLSLSIAEKQLMKHSRALVLLSCDFGTAWDSRKVVLSKKQQIDSFMDELLLSTLVLSVSPKSERAWSHRRWAIKMVAGMCSNLEVIVERESKLVEKMAERSKMNYRAWNHRSWLVSYMSVGQVLNELNLSRGWAGLHPADNSCFHYRCRLLLKLFDCASHGAYSDVYGVLELQELWKAELDWVGTLIKRYVGREALWLHRRFLALCWIKHFAKESCSLSITNIEKFMDQEIELFHFCSVVPDNSFEDYQAQAAFATTYMIWIIKQASGTWGADVQNKIDSIGLRRILNNVCPEKSFLWDAFMAK